MQFRNKNMVYGHMDVYRNQKVRPEKNFLFCVLNSRENDQNQAFHQVQNQNPLYSDRYFNAGFDTHVMDGSARPIQI